MIHTMCKTLFLAFFAALVAATTAGADSPKTADEALRFMSSKISEYKDWSGDFTQSMSMGSVSIQTKGSMTMRPPAEMRMGMSLDMFGQPMKTLIVSGKDGMVWTETEVMGQKKIMKMDLTKMNPETAKRIGAGANPLEKANPAEQAKQYQKAYDFVLKGNDEHDGRSVLVLEGTKRKDAAELQVDPQVAAILGAATTVRLHIGQKDGFVYKTEMLDASGAALLTHAFTNVKFNPGASDSEFQYTPPEGVPVLDITSMIQAPANKPASAPETTEPAPPAQ